MTYGRGLGPGEASASRMRAREVHDRPIATRNAVIDGGPLECAGDLHQEVELRLEACRFEELKEQGRRFGQHLQLQ